MSSVRPRVLPALLALLLLGGAAQACEMRVRRHPDPLMLVRMPDGERNGPQLETVREALRRIGCRTLAVDLPWARALSDLAEGQLDILPGAHRLPEREAIALFSETVWPSRNRLFMRASALRERRPLSLEEFAAQRLRLGLQVGVSYGKQLEALLPLHELGSRALRAPSRQGLWQMLARGRIDGVLADDLYSERELRQLGLDKLIAASDIVLEAAPSHTAFSRRCCDAQFVARFDAAMRAMQRDGTSAAIEQRFQALERTLR